jgi:hypothetical protein
VFTLDSLRAVTKKKFAPVQIGLSDGSAVKLSSVLKLSKDDRKAVSAALGDFNDLDVEEEDNETVELALEAISKIFGLIADKPAKLLKDLDSDDLLEKLSLMTDVLLLWAKETKLGEAQSSPS